MTSSLTPTSFIKLWGFAYSERVVYLKESWGDFPAS
jgi:hypothetical protein